MQPLFKNPRAMKLFELQTELKNRNIDCNGSQALCAAKLQEALINEHQNFDFLQLNDNQIEKWIFVGHQAHLKLHELCTFDEIVKMQVELNELTNEHKNVLTSEMWDAGNRRFSQLNILKPFTTTEARRELLVCTVALMLALFKGDSDSIVQASLFSGSMGLPVHWSVEGVIDIEKKDKIYEGRNDVEARRFRRYKKMNKV